MAGRAGLHDLFEARLALDVEAVRLAALRRTSGTIAELRALPAARGEFDGGDKRAFIERDLAFHEAVIATSRNGAMISIYEFFSASIAQTIEATLSEDLPEPDIRAHAAIIDAIEIGEPETADAAVRRFMAPVLSTLDRLLIS
jgi:DNA-binding FadR family transcriptional regulator